RTSLTARHRNRNFDCGDAALVRTSHFIGKDRTGDHLMRFFHFTLASVILSGLAMFSPADEQPGKDQTKESKKVSAEKVDRLVKQLGDDDFAKRTEAKKELEAIGEPAIAVLKKAAQSADDPEIRAAAKAIVEAFELKNSGVVRVFKGHGSRVNGVAIS